jgi:hypothetical protein
MPHRSSFKPKLKRVEGACEFLLVLFIYFMSDGCFSSIIKANAVNEASRNKVRVDNEILREVTEAKMAGIEVRC